MPFRLENVLLCSDVAAAQHGDQEIICLGPKQAEPKEKKKKKEKETNSHRWRLPASFPVPKPAPGPDPIPHKTPFWFPARRLRWIVGSHDPARRVVLGWPREDRYRVETRDGPSLSQTAESRPRRRRGKRANAEVEVMCRPPVSSWPSHHGLCLSIIVFPRCVTGAVHHQQCFPVLVEQSTGHCSEREKSSPIDAVGLTEVDEKVVLRSIFACRKGNGKKERYSSAALVSNRWERGCSH